MGWGGDLFAPPSQFLHEKINIIQMNILWTEATQLEAKTMRLQQVILFGCEAALWSYFLLVYNFLTRYKPQAQTFQVYICCTAFHKT